MLNRRNPAETKLEYTTEQIRQELAEKEALLKTNELKPILDGNNAEALQNTESEATTIAEECTEMLDTGKVQSDCKMVQNDEISIKPDQKSNTKEYDGRTENALDEPISAPSANPESKSKKKRRKKSMMKKKSSLTTSSALLPSLTASRKNSSSSSGGSASIVPSDPNDFDTEPDPTQLSSNATSLSMEDLGKSESIVTANDGLHEVNSVQDTMDTPRMCDFHFFSDTEVAASPYGSRPSTPIQSDSEFEISQREKNSDPMTSSTASWKWGEFPITPIKADSDSINNKDAKQAERNSTLNTMLSFMKETIRIRKSTSDGGVYLSDLMNSDGLDPDVVAKYFPPPKNESYSNEIDDHESGNGTSLPHSPSSVENCISKSIFDFDQDGKL